MFSGMHTHADEAQLILILDQDGKGLQYAVERWAVFIILKSSRKGA